ncbi:HrpF/NolX family T3SS translocon protein [Ramlibacter tataouinensis]|uniref:Nodulation protein nolX-like protein n=1 Tax=Ramlibacter tataouinensis (strain ATCC BAA-407 / DSM 14655 / LMG 21543 / TTB310) TaxID=365046 RepID=F5XVZ7_RAMTT|nr:HrpF/NolX family T3SS translocon protein [Ramlibacter tataouinensis]AEG94100.1 Nodulation protein nolX-like protein [Ramlibacter tataouinensis TTB310]
MNMPLQRTEQSASFPAAAAATIKPTAAMCHAQCSPLPAVLAAAIWAAMLHMLKSGGQATGTKAGLSACAGAGVGAEGGFAKQSAAALAGGTLAKPKLATAAGNSPALEKAGAAPLDGTQGVDQACPRGGGFDFALFVELVRQLCNSAFSSSDLRSGWQSHGEGQEGCPMLGQQGALLDPAVEHKRMETIAVLGRHEDKFKKAVDGKGIDKLIEDEKTPPDLVRALKDLKADPQMMEALDKAKTGKTDGKISAKDINILQSNNANKAFAEQKAEDFEETYIPSDNKDPNAVPRPITSNDAKRELFRYSDYLPKHVSRENLQKIVDGTAEQGKAPPQLVAAAKFYVDNPDAWQKDMDRKGPDEPIRKDGLCNHVSKSIELTADEDKTLKVMGENRDVFFGGSNLNDSKLKKIAGDPAGKPEVREAAEMLLDKRGSLLYTMLDNGKHGHGGNILHAADDRSIGGGDFERFMQQRNKSIAPPQEVLTAEEAAAAGKAAQAEKSDSTGQATRTADPAAARSAQAAQDMSDGLYNQPDAKKKKGGQLRDIATFFLKAYSIIMGAVSSVLAVLAKVPGLGLIAAPAALATSAASGAASIGAAALQGKDTKNAAMMAGIGVATTAASLVVPGAGKLVTESAKVSAKEGGEVAAKEGAKTAATQGGKTWGQREIVEGTAIRNDVVAQRAGKAAGFSLGVSVASNTADQTGLTDAASGRAMNEYHAHQVDHSQQQQPVA